MFGLGFVPDVHATHDGDAAEYLSTAAAAAQRPIAYLDRVGGVLDQGQTSTCVGQAFKRAIDLRAAALGLQVPSGSALAIRNLALQIEQRLDDTTADPLTDVGCEPSLAVQAIRTYGLPSEASYPFDANRTTDKVTLSELEDADKRVGLFVRQFRGITATGSDRVAQVRQALDAGLPVVLAVNGSSPEFQGYTGGGWLSWGTDRMATNHMVQLIDYAGDMFQLLNSWGRSWGAAGTATVDSSYVKATDHLFVVDSSTTP